jgi:hypothetical protein
MARLANNGSSLKLMKYKREQMLMMPPMVLNEIISKLGARAAAPNRSLERHRSGQGFCRLHMAVNIVIKKVQVQVQPYLSFCS